ncbi:CBN-GUR-3 protein [Caenorhabditis brenneri]|uniref:CBN-GUR-3 protein n=1 Tax=Caenorhabditis brenneri TaxID=135651 RepID=G0MIB3_CAEBE|nr:CBN-GUR-3 protein [Caenorhabditis brenneri]
MTITASNTLEFKWTSPRSSRSSFRTTTDAEQKISIDMSNTYCDQVLGPLYSYMMVLGLNHTHSSARNTMFKWPLTIYNYATLAVLTAATIRRISQIKQKSVTNEEKDAAFHVLNPTFVLTLCHALLMFSGLAAAFLLLKLQKQREKMYHVLDQGLGRNRNEEHDDHHFKLNKLFIGISFSFAAALSFVQIGMDKRRETMNKIKIPATKLKYLDLPDTPDLINRKLYFVILEGYVIFIASSCISLVAILFFQLCRILQFSIGQLIEEMVPKEKEECPLPEQSLQQIHDVQIHYQEISNAKLYIEQNFSFSLFYTYGCCIPLTCLLGYIAFRNGIQADMAETFSVVIWLTNTMLALMLFSIPAFMIAEEGDKLLTASFKMYHETLCEERDLLVLVSFIRYTYFNNTPIQSQMSFLSFQMHATKLTLTAGNFFMMNRKIMISLFSAIFTYFLILVQFDAEKERAGECNNQSRVLIVQPPM